MDLQLKDRVYLVSGGAAGIGEAIVRSLAAEQAVPVILDRNESRGREIVDELGTGEVHPLELADTTTLERAVAETAASRGRIDGIVNNAGVNDTVGLDSDADAFRESLDRNLVHTFALVSAAMPHLRAGEAGAIVNIGSKVSFTGQGGTSGYAAAKGALNALTREWAVDLAGDGIRVNAVLPAEVMTPMYESWIATQPDPEAALAEIAARIPLEHRFTKPEEIADLVVFLLSPRSGHTTGQILHADGGYVHLDRSISTLNS